MHRFWIVGLSILCIMCAVSSFVFGYLWIDRAVTLDFLQQSEVEISASRLRFKHLAENELIGRTKAEVLDKLKAVDLQLPEQSNYIKDEGRIVWWETTTFCFEGEKLVGINLETCEK